MSLLIGMLTRALHKTHLHLPFTPTLLAIGLLFGALHEHLVIFGDATFLVSKINDQGIVFIFVPVLIFVPAFNEDWHIFKRAFYQIMLLAVPALAITGGMMAAA